MHVLFYDKWSKYGDQRDVCHRSPQYGPRPYNSDNKQASDPRLPKGRYLYLPNWCGKSKFQRHLWDFRDLKINMVVPSKSLTIYIIVVNNCILNRAKTFEGRKKTRFQEFLRFTHDGCEVNLMQNVFRKVGWKGGENIVANNNRRVDCFQIIERN
jgi:hypothetical protein